MRGKDNIVMPLNSSSSNVNNQNSDHRIKKASYYVWFLGACECRGLRGSDVVAAVIGRLLGRERDQEPEKVTLQVSSKGIKLLQQQDGGISRSASVGSASSSKHLLPAAALTYVQQEAPPDDDLVTAVLLIYNPATRCPVHVHAYRCDSPDTAVMLRNHLAQLLNRPEQQAKLAALEARLTGRGLLQRSRSSDGGGLSNGSSGTGGANLAALYDSLAAELREKLGATGGSGAAATSGPPLLLPPRDYHGGNRGGEDDSARSSGIGSDDAQQSPLLDVRAPLNRQPSSSDEEWPLYVNSGDALHPIQPAPWKSPSYGHLNSRSSHIRNRSPRGVRPHKSDRDIYKTSLKENQRESFREIHRDSFRENPKEIYKEIGRTGSRLANRRGVSPTRNLSPIRLGIQRRVPPTMKHAMPLQGTNRDRSESPVSPRERFQDARDKFLSLEREWRSGGVLRTNTVDDQPPISNGRRYKSNHRNSRRDKKDELVWPKTDRDTGYGSRDALLRDKKPTRDYDRGYGTCDTRDSDLWKREIERSPDIWDSRGSERSLSPNEESRKHFRSNRIRSPDRNEAPRNEYQRAKSMHDLSRHRSMHDDDLKTDFRRRSLYDTLDSPHLQKSRTQPYQGHRYHSYGNLGPVCSTSSSCSSAESVTGYEMPDSQRYPGLDRVTARPDPLVTPRFSGGFSKRTFDYPVNGGHAPIHISRAHHDDYRRFRYDHNPAQFTRSTTISATQY